MYPPKKQCFNLFRVETELTRNTIHYWHLLYQDGGKKHVRKAGWFEPPSDCDAGHADAWSPKSSRCQAGGLSCWLQCTGVEHHVQCQNIIITEASVHGLLWIACECHGMLKDVFWTQPVWFCSFLKRGLFVNCQLMICFLKVCHSWANFVREEVWGRKAVRRKLRARHIDRWLGIDVSNGYHICYDFFTLTKIIHTNYFFEWLEV